MSAPDELYPPTQYGWGWLLLVVAVLAVLILGAWLLIVLTRPKTSLALPGRVQEALPSSADMLSMLRTEYTERIDRIEADHRAGTLSDRHTNLALSRLVRTFVNEYSGLEAPVLALDDLVRLGVRPELIEAVQNHYYPGIFGRGSALDPRAGVEAARRVVATWH